MIRVTGHRAGHETAFVGDGVNLSSFLTEGLANELVMLVVPAIGSRESIVALPDGCHNALSLLSVQELG